MPYDIIIDDPTDCDVYKFSMGNFLYKQGYLRNIVGWKFFNRKNIKFPLGFGVELQKQVDSWVNLKFTDEMLHHLEKSVYWLDYYYIWAYLKTYKFDPSPIMIKFTKYDSYEDVDVSYEGEWGKVIFFEIFLLSTMSELYGKMLGLDSKILTKEEQKLRNSNKIKVFMEHGVKLAEFGTRRRYSKDVQKRLLLQFIEEGKSVLQGTSNVMYCRELNLVPMGTFGHELVMYMGAKYGPLSANEILMKKWVEVYNGALGIYLADTYTTQYFLKQFDLMHSKLWDGVREDSAPDTDSYVDMIINHYTKYKIDPTTKTINHSNGINSLEKIVHMQNYRKNEIRRTFGLGTWLTHDVYHEESGLRPVDWVIKMTHTYFNGVKKYCVKLSDLPSKVTAIDDDTVKRYLSELNI